jgi:cell division protease FtsH
MSEDLGPLSYAKGEEQVFLGREIAQHRDYSEATAQKIDQAIHKLIDKAYKRAQTVLGDNLDILHKLAELLLEKETVLGRELDQLIQSLRPGIDLPSGTDKDSEKKSQKESEAEPQPETAPGPESHAGPEPDQSAA